MISLLVVLEATSGGTQRHVVDLLMSLDLQKYEITFVYSLERAKSAFAPALRQLEQRGVHLCELSMRREVRPLSDWVACWRLVRVVRAVRPDIVHLHGAKAGAIGRMAAVICRISAVVYTPHGGSFHKFSGVSGLLYLTLERVLAAASDTHFIGVSADSCQQIRARLKARESRVHLVYNGVAPLQDRKETISVLAEEPRKLIILYPAVFLEAKGHLEFIDALAHSPTRLSQEVELWFAGDGPLQRLIQEKITEYKLTKVIKLLGFVEDMVPLYARCDLVILPSRDEAFGYVALEAMQHGKMILASAVGGLLELIRDDITGRFLQGGDWHDMAGCLNAYLADPMLRARIGAAGQDFIRLKFSVTEMTEKTAAVYACALQARIKIGI
jgi:glycosyltransferase involved in cell wall biosynthesis